MSDDDMESVDCPNCGGLGEVAGRLNAMLNCFEPKQCYLCLGYGGVPRFIAEQIRDET